MEQNQLITTIDHLVFGCYSLNEGVDFIYEQLGVLPGQGGQHLLMGTHNKLLKLGNSAYLEIIAIDPALPGPTRPRWFGLDNLQPGSKPKLLTWVVRTNNIQQAVRRSTLQHGTIESVQRGIYSWQITIPAGGEMPMQGIAPAIIQWQREKHPVKDLPASHVSLLKIEAFHPDANTLNSALTAIGFQGEFSAETIGSYEKPSLTATLETRTRVVRFES